MTAKRPQKIAILGGGVAAMAAAFELTNVPGWQQRHEITIYQMGWRLGGQCASGRGPNDRIEEHGLHVLLGCYENAFRMLRQCYAELDRDADSPLATWEQAFKPYHGIIFQEHIDGTSKLWPMDYPRNSALPGDGGLFPKPRDYFSAAVGFLRGFVRTLRRLQGRNRRRLFGGLRHTPTIVRALLSLRGAHRLERSTVRNKIADLLRRGADQLWRNYAASAEDDDVVRRMLILVDICATTVAGILRDDLVDRGFDAVDDEDLVEWLVRHGAHATHHQFGRGARALHPGVCHAEKWPAREWPRCWSCAAHRNSHRMFLQGRGQLQDAGRDRRHDLRTTLSGAARTWRALRIFSAGRPVGSRA